jgi:hypothetical protein
VEKGTRNFALEWLYQESINDKKEAFKKFLSTAFVP